MTRSVHPWGAWLGWVVILPALLAIAALAAWALTPLGDLPLDGMSFAWLATLMPLAWAVMAWSRLRQRRGLARFCGELAPALTGEVDPARSAFRAGMQVAALLFIIGAILGPRWGRGTEKIEAYGLDIAVAVDVSRSMLARDVAPDRLTRARQEIERLTLNPSNRLGLLAFAGSASMKTPLTLDQAFFAEALADLDTGSAPRGGTAIAEAIYTAGDFFAASAEGATRVILVFTDGEDHEGDPVRAAREARERYGALVFTIGVGDPDAPAGAQVPARPGGTEPLVHDGQIVFSKLNMEALAKIAEAGAGKAVPISSFKSVVDLLENMDKQKLAGEERARYKPRYQVFLAFGLAALMMQTLLRERPRRRTDRLERLGLAG